jgi:hypothetical protein
MPWQCIIYVAGKFAYKYCMMAERTLLKMVGLEENHNYGSPFPSFEEKLFQFYTSTKLAYTNKSENDRKRLKHIM